LEGSGRGASFSAGALLGDREGASFSEDLEGYGEDGSGDGHHSPWGPRREFSGGLSTGDLRRLWRWAPFSTGALLRITGGPLTRNSER